eukprot:9475936-Pyramimonas_sp.AAC.2
MLLAEPVSHRHAGLTLTGSHLSTLKQEKLGGSRVATSGKARRGERSIQQVKVDRGKFLRQMGFTRGDKVGA